MAIARSRRAASLPALHCVDGFCLQEVLEVGHLGEDEVRPHPGVVKEAAGSGFDPAR